MLLKMVAPCIFGLESLVADELKQLEALNVTAENGRVFFEGGQEILARANINLRCAERVLINMGSFRADSFDLLFEGVKALPWERFIGKTDTFPVKGFSLGSKLTSIPDCQSIVKKAVVERLKGAYGISWFQETGPVYQIQFSIMKDTAMLMIDTSGEGLHKRGYRPKSAAAPIKETLAAAMVKLARVRDRAQLYDPMLGSGTILIEGAMQGLGIAPGLKRGFAAERFAWLPQNVFTRERQRALSQINRSCEFKAWGADIDPFMLELAKANADKAGIADKLVLQQADIKDFCLQTERAIVITNPPYGERLLDIKAAEEIYRQMGKLFVSGRGRSYFVISPHEEFERLFGRPADKRRKLYNGMIKCQLFMYFR